MWGYPSLSGIGTHLLGRHATLFYRRPDTLHFMAYQVFLAGEGLGLGDAPLTAPRVFQG